MASKESRKKKQPGSAGKKWDSYPREGWFKRLAAINLRAEAVVDLDDVVGEIDPRIYGHFILGLGSSAASADLVGELHPPLLRAEVGDGFQQSVDFLGYCKKVGAEAYLALDVRRVTPEAAASWAAQKRSEAAPIRLWGLFSGDDAEMVDPAEYARQVRPFLTALRAADPEIQLVAAGKVMLPGNPDGAETWNRTVVAELGDQLDYLAIRIMHPAGAAAEEMSDPERLYHSLLSAPHSVEEQIQSLANLIRAVAPDRKIGIVLDAFNLQLGTGGHATLRDGLYVAGMLNAFQRQCTHLKVATLAQPVIVTPEVGPAFPMPLYFPYLLYREMEPQMLSVVHWSPVYQAAALGRNISAHNQVPYIDLTVTRSTDGRRVVLAVTNRNPHRQANVMVSLKGDGNRKFQTVAARLMAGPNPLAGPQEVSVKAVKPPKMRYAWLDLDLPPASLMVVELDQVN